MQLTVRRQFRVSMFTSMECDAIDVRWVSDAPAAMCARCGGRRWMETRGVSVRWAAICDARGRPLTLSRQYKAPLCRRWIEIAGYNSVTTAGRTRLCRGRGDTERGRDSCVEFGRRRKLSELCWGGARARRAHAMCASRPRCSFYGATWLAR